MSTLDDLDATPALLEVLPDPPLWLQNAIYPAGLDRSLITALLPSGGVIRGGLRVAPRGAGANMSVDVDRGGAVVVGTDAPGQGSYLCRSDDVVNLAVPAAPGAGLSRRDSIVARVYDDSMIGGDQSQWSLEVISGDAAAVPVAPALPPSSVMLAGLLIPSGLAAVLAAQITDTRRRADGGIGIVDERFAGPADARVMAGNMSSQTDAFGVFVVPMPAGGRLVAGTASHAELNVDIIYNRDGRTQPGANGCAFQAIYADSNTPVRNSPGALRLHRRLHVRHRLGAAADPARGDT